MTHVKKQHIVPEFLLKNFSNGKYIWSFDKAAITERWTNEKIRTVSSVPTEDFFYDQTIGSPHNSMEYVLSEIENKVAPIITDLISSNDLTTLSIIQKEIVAEFLCYQIFRTKAHLNHTREFLKVLHTPIEEITKVKIKSNPREFWLENLKKVDEYKNYILDKTWILFGSTDEFYLSDNPVVFQNIVNNREHRGNLGLNSVGIEIYLPLSSSLLLGMFCRSTISSPIPNIKCSPGNIENVNWLQIVNATRFIFSKSNDFGLVDKMIQEKVLP